MLRGLHLRRLAGVRRWLVLLGVLLGFLAPAAPSTVAARSFPSVRMRVFAEAAHRSGVPLPVLIGLAWEQSMLSDHQGRPSIDHGYGLLDLSARSRHDTLGAAARLLHVAPARLRISDRLNVLGGALLLAHQEHALGYRRLPRTVNAWTRAVVTFTGMRSAFAARLIVNDMYRALRHGIHGGGVRLAAMPRVHPEVTWLRQLQPLTSKTGETAGPADYSGAKWEPANYNNYTDAKRPSDYHIRYIVIHDTEGSCGTTVNWFSNPASQASAHYLVCLDGTVIQTVHERDIAWHAGNWPINLEAIGIEHEGYSDQAYYTRAQYLASAALVRYLCHKYGIDPNRNVIFGHENVPAADHTDPGKYWNWDFYMREVRGDATGYAGGITAIALVAGNATIYSCPQVSCSVLGSANWGEQFFIAHEQPGWDAIYYGGKTGWVQSNNIVAGSGTVVHIKSGTAVLSGPKGGNSSLGTIPAGQSYISLTQDNGYWYIYYNHRYGFVSNGAVQTTPCPAPAAGAGVAPVCILNSGSSVAVTPNKGSGGTLLAVAGRGVAPGPVNLSLAGRILGTAEAGPRGMFWLKPNMPQGVPAGPATLTAIDSSGQKFRTPFVVQAPITGDPQVSVNPRSISPGGKVTISGTGFVAQNTVTIKGVFPGGSNQKPIVQLAPTGTDGRFSSVKITLPASAGNGKGKVTVSSAGASVTASVTVHGGQSGSGSGSRTKPPAESTITPAPSTPTPVNSATPTATAQAPAITLTPVAASPGSRVRIQGTGFPIRTLVNTSIYGIVIEARTGKLGGFKSAFMVPDTMPPGTYPVVTSGSHLQAQAQLKVVARKVEP